MAYFSVPMPVKLFSDLHGEWPEAVIRCPFDSCNTRIIGTQADSVSKVVRIENAPGMANPGHTFLQVNDVWEFDNIGVSRAALELQASEKVGDLSKVERLLICGECDKGPIGFAGYTNVSDTDVKNLCYYLSCDTVKFDTKA